MKREREREREGERERESARLHSERNPVKRKEKNCNAYDCNDYYLSYKHIPNL